MLLFQKLVYETQMSKPLEATILGTIFQKIVNPSTPQSFSYVHFTIIHPLVENVSKFLTCTMYYMCRAKEKEVTCGDI